MKTPLAQLPAGGDPLARLRDVVPAPEPPWWPPAPGWWALAGVAAVAAAALAAWLWLRRRRRRYRRLALAELERAYESCWRGAVSGRAARPDAAGRYLQEVNQVLRRAALVAWPRERVAALTGDEWLAFLDRSAGMRGFRHGPGQALGAGPYRAAPECDVRAVHALARKWLRGHRSRAKTVPETAEKDGGRGPPRPAESPRAGERA